MNLLVLKCYFVAEIRLFLERSQHWLVNPEMATCKRNLNLLFSLVFYYESYLTLKYFLKIST